MVSEPPGGEAPERILTAETDRSSIDPGRKAILEVEMVARPRGLDVDAEVWSSLEIAKLVAGLLTPLIVAVFGYRISLRLKAQDTASENERQQRQIDREAREAEAEQSKERERLEREATQDEIERKHKPHIELRLECIFIGKRNDQHLVNFLVIAANRGQVLHKFNNVTLRVRGIKNEQFRYWEGRTPLAYFPHKIVETNLVQKGWNFIFIEPGVIQQISLVTLIATDYTYVLAHVEFEYKKFWPHTAQAVYAVPSGAG